MWIWICFHKWSNWQQHLFLISDKWLQSWLSTFTKVNGLQRFHNQHYVLFTCMDIASTNETKSHSLILCTYIWQSRNYFHTGQIYSDSANVRVRVMPTYYTYPYLSLCKWLILPWNTFDSIRLMIGSFNLNQLFNAMTTNLTSPLCYTVLQLPVPNYLADGDCCP